MEPFEPLIMLGIRVREVRDLAEETLMCVRERILFVDDDLTFDERRLAVAMYLEDEFALA
ncbi:hypothetical protein FE697_015365 [Mumia zhuanghuii]|uniref:Uncharacterized protein n=2 Tax=Mumia TaxID=1546255 RepID=A0ABW1QQ10_9ACTN|nr:MULTISPECIES: hypothetical protein [Mumia]KAA1422511.1 hypothetical protein FE697_015365 [Mumia zhuanghuii]